MSCFQSFCMAFFAKALVTAQEGWRSGISHCLGSGGWSTQGVLVKSEFTTTTLFPAKLLHNSKWTPLKVMKADTNSHWSN